LDGRGATRLALQSRDLFDESRDSYRWFCTAIISTTFFDKLLALHQAGLLCSLRLNLRLDIFVEAIRRYVSDPVSDFYLVPEKGNAKSPSTALGFVADLDVVETTVALQPLGLRRDDEASASPTEMIEQESDKRVERSNAIWPR
jgi:hypothetical protein